MAVDNGYPNLLRCPSFGPYLPDSYCPLAGKIILGSENDIDPIFISAFPHLASVSNLPL